ncbi:hypothetical protein H9P43_010016 [Blastocladiella emersonii ATCC 22665]|nr:hypothetical protein H9P43_010016 [Blastocladiella emersonii ATCC 22665]
MSYLSANGFGIAIGFSHAGMTAEGDDSVLMQKVAKELIDAAAHGIVKYADPKWAGDLASPEGLLALLRTFEQALLRELATSMEVQTKKQGKRVFDVWMGTESDRIQALARAFGERMSADAFVEAIAAAKAKGDAEAAATLRQVFDLYLLHVVNQQLAHYLVRGILTPAQGQTIQARLHAAVKVVAAYALPLVSSLGLDGEMVRAPIAGDWLKFNSFDNQGETTTRPRM